ncbi:branched-chain amino acid ABC transporter ATP-binding protein/permease [Hydrogenophaga sp.]|uniref:branched-chain amino acid ABC transporter ATP-binding protein/permease n=2 Tax=Hydrogenophaga sp. TaxID=1904254 RepID=UPI0027309137|nr:branched-chain amino acid ABC transporter ATP-binding protein/permease [Hydrogenophaga sp.]MDP2074686.1 branched-chain amino acid ABC transporter ATP-binding protein/permease [Hydrogenophaga sp.]MDP3106345.1 branched-chain amino acid ABC transporter ATP-binding protein/permease [Hydrogenophaga sp.]MDP3351038.1 branched-chain amino acid ABC transporter ATP-binding protein/permease [Hydrogenophaga sp.]MDZ4398933.1 branched-chain amino acid ABC transporter ATP-binding protein/permease [Hydrogen
MSTLHTSKPLLGLGSGWQITAVAGVLALGAVLALTLNGYWVFVLANVALLAIVGVGLNVLVGLTGQVSFGHVGFYAIGAYTMAILTTKTGLSFWLVWPIAALIGGVFGALVALPALRVKGPYLAMITIAFGLIVEHSIVEASGLTGGQNGIMGLTAPSLGSLAQGERAMALLAIGAAALALAGYAWLSRGTWGAAMRAVRDAETAAESVGLNPLAIKTVAFAVSALCAAAAGALFAPLSGFVTPHTFGFVQSILFVLVVMIGGAGSVAGPLVGAIIVGLLPELLSGLEEYRLLFFGAMLLLVLWVAPDGVAGLVRRLRESLLPRSAVAVPTPTSATLALPTRARQPIAAQGLTMLFGGVRAVSDLHFTAPAGQVTSLIGPNGAGKSTALNMLGGFYLPTTGAFALGGQALQGQNAMQISRQGVARTYQTSQLFGSLSVQDNVVIAMQRGALGPLLGSARRSAPALTERARQLLAFCGYTGHPDTLAGDLPHVDRRLVEIARSLATDPDALLLDEPAAGLSREDKLRLGTLLQRIADAGLTVLLVEHDMTLVMDISHQVVVLDAGVRLAVGSPAQVQADPAVQLAYLGESLETSEESTTRGNAINRPEMLGVGSLVAGYGAEPVLHGIDLQVRRGEVVALLGANGAGKSTLMKALAGLHRPIQGGIHLEGRELMNMGAEQVVAHGVVLVPEGRQVFAELSVLDNIRLGAFLQTDDREARVEEQLVRFPRLRERLHQRAGLLSGGEQQMLAIARALMSRPRILLLDEPSLGLAPKVIAELFAALDALRREGMTLLLVDQMAGLALALADRAYVMEEGRIVAHGTSAEIAANGALAQAYLGESGADHPQPAAHLS